MEHDRCRTDVAGTPLCLFPVPLNRLNRLYEIDPILKSYLSYPANELADLLNIKTAKAIKLNENLLQN